MLTDTSHFAESMPLVQHEAGLLAVLLAVLAGIFWLTQQSATRGFFKVVPALIFCYFVPTLLTTLGVIPDKAPLYSWIKEFLLPASLLLLILALDVRLKTGIPDIYIYPYKGQYQRQSVRPQ